MDDFNGVSVDASRYGTTAEALAAALNARLFAQVGPVAADAPEPETGLRVWKASVGPLRRSQRGLIWAVLVGLSILVVTRLLH